MKKLFTLLVALVVAADLFAQVGVTGGVTSTSTTLQGAYSDIQTQSVNQYHVGLVSKMELPAGLVLQPSLVYNVKGNSLKDIVTEGVSLESIDTKTGNVEFQLQLQWGLTLSKDVLRVYALVEPFASYAINGSIKYTNVIADILQQEPTWNEISDWTGINRLQYGFGVGAGIEVFDNIQLSARYYWDMGDMFTETGDIVVPEIKRWAAIAKDSVCNGIKVSLAYIF